MKKNLTTLFLVLAICLNSKATNYYIAASGNDANNGTSTSTPWKTLNKLNSFFSSLKAGDNVYLNRGDVFYGSIVINKNGASGSPITISAYGSGTQPVITGLTAVTSWTNLGNNIWESASAVSALSTCNIVVINGVSTPMGRYPNANVGYLIYTGTSTNSISSTSLNASTLNWTGAQVCVRKANWMIDKGLITSASGGTLNYTSGCGYPGRNNYGFFIQNDARTLDLQNEWYYNPSTKKIRIYSTSTPTNVQVSTIDNIIRLNGFSYITFSNINSIGSNSDAVFLDNTGHCTIQNCAVNFAGHNGIQCYWDGSSPNFLCDNNTISNTNNNSINVMAQFTGAVITNNTTQNSGRIAGASDAADGSAYAIHSESASAVIQHNTIKSSGYIGIGFDGTGANVSYNSVDSSCLVKGDCGGIYTNNPKTGKVIAFNTVLNSIGSPAGTDNLSQANGIYCDNGSLGVNIHDNTVAHMNGIGIYLRNSNSITVKNNTSYDCLENGLSIKSDVSYYITGDNVKNNIWFAKVSPQQTENFRTLHNDVSSWGTIDSNYLARPIDDNLTIELVKTVPSYTDTYNSLASWQSFSSYDAHSHKSPKAITDVNDLRFEYNATSSIETVSLPYNYIDVKGNVYNGSVTLTPYTSVVLIKNGAISGKQNQSPTAGAGSDQTITLPTSTVSLSGSGTDPDGTISAYNWTKISGPSSGTITSPSAAATTVTALAQGVYQFQFKVTDNAGATDMDTVQIKVNAASSLLPAVNPANTVNGINYSYYESNSGYSAVPVFSTLTPVKTGTSTTFNISPAKRDTLFSFHFAGYINVPSDGQYTFYTLSDDGSNLYIDGVLVVNNDKIQWNTEKFGTIGLMAGKHAISVGYFQQKGGSILTVSYSGPGISKQVVPASALFIVPGTLALNNNNQTIISSTKLGVQAYPNPFTNFIQVNINGEAGNYELALVDISGKILWIKSGIKNAGAFMQSVNTSSLQRGIYFLKVIQNNNTSVIKLVK